MLRLSLRDGERVVVNGAVLRARGRTELLVENGAAVLRGRDVIAPDEVTTPARALYQALMMAYVDEPRRDAHRDEAAARIRDLHGALESPEARADLLGIVEHAARGEWYGALGRCRSLIAYETQALARA